MQKKKVKVKLMLKMKRKKKLCCKCDCVTLGKKKKSSFSSITVLRHSSTTKRQKPATCDLKDHFLVSLLLLTGQNFLEKMSDILEKLFPLSSTQQLFLAFPPNRKKRDKRDTDRY